MGIQVKRNSKEQFNLVDSINNEQLHEKRWISIQEAKKILIERLYFNFLKDAISVDLEFPNGYSVNGILERSKVEMTGNEFLLNCFREGNSCKSLFEKFDQMKTDLNLNLEYEL